MGEVVIQIAKWALTAVFIMAVGLALMVLIGLAVGGLVIVFNLEVLNDIFALIQIWLPFNLNVLLIWISAAGIAYLGYRLALMIFNLLNAYIGR